MNIKDYLVRINYSKSIQADVNTLSGLQLAHMQNIPFENLDIGLGRKIELGISAIWEKIIVRNRGGFCYELNGLFAWLLKEIGFEVTCLNARDYHEEDGTFSIDFDHLTLMVKVPNESTRWLTDVGWGDSFTQPLDIDNSTWQKQGLRSYLLESFKNGYQLREFGFSGKTDRQYYFDLAAHNFPFEYEAACDFHQTSPNSVFTKKRIISRLTESGRVSLDNNELIVTTNGQKTRSPIQEDQRAELLREHFGVIL